MDFQSERLPRCSGGLWLQCCTLHLFTAERHTSLWGKRRVGVWCTSSSLEIWLQPHYVLFQSPSAYWNTLSACLQTCLFYFHTLHFIWVLIIWIIEQKKRSYKKCAQWDQDSFKRVCRRWTFTQLPRKTTELMAERPASWQSQIHLWKWNSVQVPELWPAVEMQIAGIKSWWTKGGRPRKRNLGWIRRDLEVLSSDFLKFNKCNLFLLPVNARFWL